MTALGMVLLVVGALVATAEAHYPAHGFAGGLGVLAMALGAVLAISGLGAGLALGLLAGVALAGIGGGAVLLSVRQGRGRPGPARAHRRGGPGRSDRRRAQLGGVRGQRVAARRRVAGLPVGRDRRTRRLDAHESDDAAGGLHPGDRVVVERLSGLTLAVRPAEKWELLH